MTTSTQFTSHLLHGLKLVLDYTTDGEKSNYAKNIRVELDFSKDVCAEECFAGY